MTDDTGYLRSQDRMHNTDFELEYAQYRSLVLHDRHQSVCLPRISGLAITHTVELEHVVAHISVMILYASMHASEAEPDFFC